MLSNFSLLIDQVRFSVLKFIPRTVPLVDGPKAFSLLGHGSARGMFKVLQSEAYFTENCLAKSVLEGDTTGTSSS